MNMRFLRYIHKIFKPNCECAVCETPRCQLCEEYKWSLQMERLEKEKLLNALLKMGAPPQIVQMPEKEEPPQIIRGAQRFSNIRRALEEQDRLRAAENRARDVAEANATREQVKVTMDKIKPMTEAEIDEFLKDEKADNQQQENTAVQG